jgi:hypothetical protein
MEVTEVMGVLKVESVTFWHALAQYNQANSPTAFGSLSLLPHTYCHNNRLSTA